METTSPNGKFSILFSHSLSEIFNNLLAHFLPETFSSFGFQDITIL
jgi:hypothetical protein